MKHRSLVTLACSALVLTSPVSATATAEPIPSVNNWNCKPLPDSAFPRPIVFIHGIFGDIENWRAEIDDLTEHGACVFAKNYGAHASTGYALNGLAPLAQSEDELSLFIDEVRARTASARVDLVGHSEGGLLAGALSRRLGPVAYTRWSCWHRPPMAPASAEQPTYFTIWVLKPQSTRCCVPLSARPARTCRRLDQHTGRRTTNPRSRQPA